MSKAWCAVPFVTGFTAPGGGFRNCCMTQDQNWTREVGWKDWWQGADMQAFRQQLLLDQPSPNCARCVTQEQVQGHSFRTAVNEAEGEIDHPDPAPRRWNLLIGNVCNLACWTCDENSSSVIQRHKSVLNILPADFQDPAHNLEQQLLELDPAIMKSYRCHDTVTLTLLGGEPLLSPVVLKFLQGLIDADLGPRTRLEFQTNATRGQSEILKLLDRTNWQHISVFASVDAVGIKSEWLRYGCDWNQIHANIHSLRSQVDYFELHCTLSVLNLADLPELYDYSLYHDLSLRVMTLSDPWFMSLNHWDGPALVDPEALHQRGLAHYNDLVGSQARPGARQHLADYINQFRSLRRPLADYDPELSKILGQ